LEVQLNALAYPYTEIILFLDCLNTENVLNRMFFSNIVAAQKSGPHVNTSLPVATRHSFDIDESA